MDNKFRGYMDKLRASANQLVSDRKEDGDDTRIELSRHDYELLKQKAHEQHTTVNTLVDRAVKQYLDSQAGGGQRSPVSVERKENNPLLYLDGLTQNLE